MTETEADLRVEQLENRLRQLTGENRATAIPRPPAGRAVACRCSDGPCRAPERRHGAAAASAAAAAAGSRSPCRRTRSSRATRRSRRRYERRSPQRRRSCRAASRGARTEAAAAAMRSIPMPASRVRRARRVRSAASSASPALPNGPMSVRRAGVPRASRSIWRHLSPRRDAGAAAAARQCCRPVRAVATAAPGADTARRITTSAIGYMQRKDYALAEEALRGFVQEISERPPARRCAVLAGREPVPAPALSRCCRILSDGHDQIRHSDARARCAAAARPVAGGAEGEGSRLRGVRRSHTQISARVERREAGCRPRAEAATAADHAAQRRAFPRSKLPRDDHSPVSASEASRLFADLEERARARPGRLRRAGLDGADVARGAMAQAAEARPEADRRHRRPWLAQGSAREARDVKKLAASLGVEHRDAALDRRQAERPDFPPRHASARYALLAKAARKAGAAYILTAHTRDDQAETLLMRLVARQRPCGPCGDGAAQIRARRASCSCVRCWMCRSSRLIATLERQRYRLRRRSDQSRPDVSPGRAGALMPQLARKASMRATLARLAARLARAERGVGGRWPIARSGISCRATANVRLIDAHAFLTLPEEIRLRLLQPGDRSGAGTKDRPNSARSKSCWTI